MTKIEWTDAVWNPVTGCSKVSAGCKNCYAEGVANRFWGDRKFTDVRTHVDRLDAPLRWRKPRRVFVNSMSDLFHDAVPDEFIAEVFAVMAHARKHTFQVLTKRPERMREFMLSAREMVRRAMHRVGREIEALWTKHQLLAVYAKSVTEFDASFDEWPKRNVWLGVSCEDQRAADERIPLLLQTPAAVRFVSAEPLLGPIDFKATPQPDCDRKAIINWVIVGGESGPKARPCDVAWIRSIVRQCKESSVPVFVKQLGRHPRGDRFDMSEASFVCVDAAGWSEHDGRRLPLRDRKGGDTAEWGDELRVREFPRGGA